MEIHNWAGRGKSIRKIALLLAAAVLSGCAAPGQEQEAVQIEPTPVQRVQIDFALPFREDEPLSRCIKQLAAEYAQEQPVDVTLRFEVSGEERLLTELLSEKSADVYLLPSEYVSSFGGQGYLKPVSDLDGRFYAAAKAACSVGDVSFAVPYLGCPMALLYNTGAADQADEEPLRSWQSVLELCEKAAKQEDGSGFAGFGAQCEELNGVLMTLLEYRGGVLVTRWGGVDQANLQSAPMRQAIDDYTALLKTDRTGDYASRTPKEAAELLIESRAAVALASPGILRMAQLAGAQVKVEILPEGGKSALRSYGLAIAQAADEDDTRAAEAWIRWLGKPLQMDRVLSAQYEGCEKGTEFLLPVSDNAQNLSFYTDHPEYLPFERQMSRVLGQGNEKQRLIEENALAPALHSIFSGRLTQEEGLAEAQVKAQQILQN